MRRDDLERLAVDELEDGAQHLVALDDGVERLLEQVQVERAAVAERDLDVVERVAGAQLLQEPEALLGERKGVWAGVAARHDPVGVRRLPVLGAQQPLEQLAALCVQLGRGAAPTAHGVPASASCGSRSSLSTSSSDSDRTRRSTSAARSRTSSGPASRRSTAATSATVGCSNSVRIGSS